MRRVGMEAGFRRRGSFREAVRFGRDGIRNGTGVNWDRGRCDDEGTDSDNVCAFSSALFGTRVHAGNPGQIGWQICPKGA